MTETQSDFLIALKKFVWIVVSIVTVIWLIIHCLSVKYLIDKIETPRREILPCKCSQIKVESSGNTNTIHFNEESPIDKRVKEVLIKKGKVDGNLPRVMPVERQLGS